MPNNSSARREKGKKKKRTAYPPLHKEDTASVDEARVDEARVDSIAHPLSLSGQEECVMDTSSSSLSLEGAEKETPPMIGHAVMTDYYNSLPRRHPLYAHACDWIIPSYHERLRRILNI